MGVVQTARRRNLRVPDDLSVVGFDDIRFARCVDPPLTTVAQPMRAIGEGTVRLLLHILSGAPEPPDSVRLPHTLTVRSSTAPPRTGLNQALRCTVPGASAAGVSSKHPGASVQSTVRRQLSVYSLRTLRPISDLS